MKAKLANTWAQTPDGENNFPWNPKDGIMPKKPKRMGNRKLAMRPRSMRRGR